MKKTHLLVVSLAAMMALAGCNTTPTVPTSTEPPTTEPTTDPSTEPTTPVETIEHQDEFTREIENVSSTRAYDERFDEMLDDFSGESINGKTTGTINSNTLKVLVDSQNVDAIPNSADRAIYKVGTGYYDLPTYDGIGIKVRISGNKSLKLSNLVLALRGDDSCAVYPIRLSEALDVDGEALPELSEEYQDLVVCPQLSIEDANAVYTLNSGEPSSIKVLETMVGFHIYALDEECSAILEISEVYLTKAGEKTVIDSFDRTAVNKADPTCWWRDSTGFIVRKGVTLKDTNYVTPAINGEYSNLVLTVCGDTTGTTINSTPWASLVDKDGVAVSNAVNGAYYSLAISLDGLTAPFTISSTSEIHIAEVFVTNFEVPAAVVEYPHLDMDSFFVFDNFNREQTGFDGDYDAAITNEKTLAAGLSYQLSYNNGQYVSVDGNNLVFDGASLNDPNGYINYKSCNDNLSGSYKYMVVAVKLEDGATLNDFRFNARGAGVVYCNQMWSAEGLKIATVGQEDYPYVKDGYTWLVIDTELSGITGTDPYIDYYYTGAGKLLIDFVAFANPAKKAFDAEEKVKISIADQAVYTYAGGFASPVGNQYVKLTTASTGENTTIDAIRFEGVNGAQYFHDGAVKDIDGNVISGTTPVGEVIVDLVASGLKASADVEQYIHVHADGSLGQLDISVSVLTEKVGVEAEINPLSSDAYDLTNYAYMGGFYLPYSAEYLVLTLKCGEGETVDLKSIRIESAEAGATPWIKDGAVIGADGQAISADTAVTAEGIKVVIDLSASGLATFGQFHIHGGADGSTGHVQVGVSVIKKVGSYSAILYGYASLGL